MAAGDSASTSLEHTPTWALATVCFFIVFVSIILEHSIHLLTNWLRRHGKTALYDAVGRLKSELMLLGFMSLLLAVTQDKISRICVPSKVANTMLPCRRQFVTPGTESLAVFVHSFNRVSADLIPDDYTNSNDSIDLHKLYSRRLADEDAGDDSSSGGYETAKNTNATDSCSSIMRSWKAWEKETQTTDYQIANDPNRFRFTRQTTFARRHDTCTETTSQLWIAHFSARLNNFNFQKYIERSLDEDFKVVVSISPFMWFLVVIFMLVDVRGWHSYLWISYVPLLIVLVLGTKLEVIVARMALQLKNQNNVVIGAPLVQVNDDLFWFRRPRFVLHLLYLTLFVIQFGLDSCYHEHTVIIITRTVMARKKRAHELVQHPPTVMATQRGLNDSHSKFSPHNASTSTAAEENHVLSISESRKQNQAERMQKFISS
ncbi:UNVERIFIED_CONTAM: MLO-like protein 3 [Sesamum radiatum]|uniref:MLO-like protein n=1 Tax=Sesamum radiatum TaxID=300843 RepID=A0AAW2KUT8_SESRA